MAMNKLILKFKIRAYPWVMMLKENTIVLLNWIKKNYKKIAINRQYKIFQKGIVVWNNWRKENPDIKIDLTEIDFGGRYPGRVPLDEADFSKANLHGARLQRAMLEKVDFSGAILTDAFFVSSQ